ncbi:MAG: hypothetical protein QMD71_09125 [bacterium]|nr:hypothetical protein [bacterium]
MQKISRVYRKVSGQNKEALKKLKYEKPKMTKYESQTEAYDELDILQCEWKPSPCPPEKIA